MTDRQILIDALRQIEAALLDSAMPLNSLELHILRIVQTVLRAL